MAYQNRYYDDDDDDDYYKRQARRREQQRAKRDPNVFVLSECCDELCCYEDCSCSEGKYTEILCSKYIYIYINIY